jgi:DtxR family Mn-dependent transcriptional regulator
MYRDRSIRWNEHPSGSFGIYRYLSLAEIEPGAAVMVARVNDSDSQVLQYASKLGISLNRKIKVKERVAFDGSLRVEIGKREQFVSAKLASNIFVEEE